VRLHGTVRRLGAKSEPGPAGSPETTLKKFVNISEKAIDREARSGINFVWHPAGSLRLEEREEISRGIAPNDNAGGRLPAAVAQQTSGSAFPLPSSAAAGRLVTRMRGVFRAGRHLGNALRGNLLSDFEPGKIGSDLLGPPPTTWAR